MSCLVAKRLRTCWGSAPASWWVCLGMVMEVLVCGRRLRGLHLGNWDVSLHLCKR